MSLFSDLKSAPSTLATSSKYTTLNGIIYLVSGGLLLIWPGAVQTLFQDPEFVGNEAALMRILGLTVAILGWLYIFGGRSGGRQVVAATVLDRITIVPLVLVSLAMTGVFPHLLLTFAFVDPALALTAWYLMAREEH